MVDEKKPHILCLNETKIDRSIADDDIDIEDYALNRKDWNCFGGGVAIYVHKSIRFKERVDLGTIELETITIELNIPFVKPIIPGVHTRLNSEVLFLRIKFMKNWREIIVRSYQNKPLENPSSANQILCLVFYLPIERLPSTGNVQYSDLF